VVERHEGVAKNADFGSLGEIAAAEFAPLTAAEGARLASLLESAWAAFDAVAATAPEHLRKGPRGGGRDTSQIADHVTGAEAAYARKIGLRGEKAADGASRLRASIAAALRDPAGLAIPGNGWPPRYAARRMAWHVLDHLWEIEDKSSAE
jgi:hypothetical protein